MRRAILMSLLAAAACGGDGDAPQSGLTAMTELRFDRTVVGTGATATVTITNHDASRAAPIGALEVAGAGFAVDPSGCQASVPAGGSCELAVTFTPTVLGDATAELTVRSLGASTVTSLAGVGGWRLEVAATPTGTVTSTPPGIDCGTTCSGIFVDGVTLTFAPVPGQSRVTWSVPGCSGLTCEIPATVQGVSATVEALPAQEVIVTRAGTGQGSVTSTPAGITCGTTCSGFFTVPVTLTATPAPGSTFVGWSDPSCGTSATCLLPVATGTTTVVATFDIVGPRIINVVVSGPAPGEVVAFQGGAVAGRCQGSCSLTVSSALETIVTADTPHEYSSLTGPGCDGLLGRCTLPAGTTDASYAATFSFAPEDDWTFFGEPGERFVTGAFGATNRLIASSQQRMIELDATGQLVWTQPPADRILAGPGTDFYTWTVAGGTVKRSSDGSALWTFPGELEAVDLATGNILVHPSFTTMAVLLPTGVPLWTMPGQGTDLDSAGIVYEPYTYVAIGDPTQPQESFVHLRARRYSAAGEPITELPDYWLSNILSPSHTYATGFEVSGDRIGGFVSYEGENDAAVNFGLATVADAPTPFVTEIHRFNYLRERLMGARLATAATSAIGLLTDQNVRLGYGGNSFYDYTFGFDLNRVARDGTKSVVSRLTSIRGEGHGVAALGLAGGASDRFAVLGWYRPVRAGGVSSGPDRGIIQAFKP